MMILQQSATPSVERHRCGDYDDFAPHEQAGGGVKRTQWRVDQDGAKTSC
ncbi:MAG: hypothetical protein ACOC97_01550 [Myxococcota bacterium]